MTAIKNGHKEVVKALLKRHVEINAIGSVYKFQYFCFIDYIYSFYIYSKARLHYILLLKEVVWIWLKCYLKLK